MLYFYSPLLQAVLKFMQAKSMNFFVDAQKRNPKFTIRVHPLLLSLAHAINESETNPTLSTISEYDEAALRSNYYTSPSTLPPLEMHFSGTNGPSILYNQNSYALTSVAGCRDCMASTPPVDSVVEGNATQGNSAATFNAPDGKAEPSAFASSLFSTFPMTYNTR